MTEAQRTALQDLCTRYKVTFRETDYIKTFDLPDGYVAGWIGGRWTQDLRPTIYVGVSADGEVSS